MILQMIPNFGFVRSLSSSQRGVTASTPKVRPVASDLSASARQFQSLGIDVKLEDWVEMKFISSRDH